MKLAFTLVLALFAIIATAFALNPADYDETTLRVYHTRLKLGNLNSLPAAQQALAEYLSKCSVYGASESGNGEGKSTRFWFVSSPEILALSGCDYATMSKAVSPGIKTSGFKEQPGQIDISKCIDPSDNHLVCSAGFDGSACVQCKNSAVGASIIAVIAFVALALFF